jgi:hypothetical protein
MRLRAIIQGCQRVTPEARSSAKEVVDGLQQLLHDYPLLL